MSSEPKQKKQKQKRPKPANRPVGYESSLSEHLIDEMYEENLKLDKKREQPYIV